MLACVSDAELPLLAVPPLLLSPSVESPSSLPWGFGEETKNTKKISQVLEVTQIKKKDKKNQTK